MARYKICLDGELQDEVYNSYEEAEAWIPELLNACEIGAEILHMSNPGDYEYDEDDYERPDIEIVEID